MNVSRLKTALTFFILLISLLPFFPLLIEGTSLCWNDEIQTNNWGDEALLELSILKAAEYDQYIGPYSRFGWNNPGPAYSYTALPVYVLCGQKSASIDYFGYLLSFFSIIIFIYLSLKYRMPAAELIIHIVLFNIFYFHTRSLDSYYYQNIMWNPYIIVLPIWLSFFTAVFIARGHFELVPFFAALSSYIVQSYIPLGILEFTLVVASLLAMLRSIKQTHGNLLTAYQQKKNQITRSLFLTLFIIVAFWHLPMYYELTDREGNFSRLLAFVSETDHRQGWNHAMITFFNGLIRFPQDLSRSFLHPDLVLSDPEKDVVNRALAVLIILVLINMILLRKKAWMNAFLGVFLLLSYGAIAYTIKRIVGEIHYYLVNWISLFGLLTISFITITIAGMVSAVSPVQDQNRFNKKKILDAGLLILAILFLPFYMSANLNLIKTGITDSPFYEARFFPQVQALSNDLNPFFLNRNIGKIKTIIDPDVVPDAAGVLLFLYKNGVEFTVQERYIHDYGRQFQEESNQTHIVSFVSRQNRTFIQKLQEEGFQLISGRSELKTRVFYKYKD